MNEDTSYIVGGQEVVKGAKAAIALANSIFVITGVVVSIEDAKPVNCGSILAGLARKMPLKHKAEGKKVVG